MTHTKEPWYAFEGRLQTRETEQDGSPRPGLVEMTHDNARRIAACVNACAGIPIEMLEGGAPALKPSDKLAALALALSYGKGKP